jgi:hypothetical protein
LGGANAFGNLSLSETRGGARFQEQIKKRKLFLQPVVLSLYVGPGKGTRLKSFVREHL